MRWLNPQQKAAVMQHLAALESGNTYEFNQSINHLFVSDQWSISKKKKEIDNKNR